MPRPQFLTTKGQRNHNDNIPDFDPLSRYRILARGIYEWDGLPEDVPSGFIEESLFDYGCIGARKVDGLGICVMPAAPVTRGIYGNPLTWLPCGLLNTANIAPLVVQGDEPTLWIGEPPAERAEIYGRVLKNALISLNQNCIALRQPIALEGKPGSTADGIVLMTEIEGGEQFIPVIDSNRVAMNVIDLKAHDYTASLINTANAMDNEILTIIGVRNTGTEKASGVTMEETTSLHQELRVTSDNGLKLRLAWCEKINARLGTSFSCRIADSYMIDEPDEQNEPNEPNPSQEGDANDGN